MLEQSSRNKHKIEGNISHVFWWFSGVGGYTNREEHLHGRNDKYLVDAFGLLVASELLFFGRSLELSKESSSVVVIDYNV